MSDNYIDKNSSLVIKGIAIILMVIHHLFAFPDRIYEGVYVSIFRINNISIEYYMAVLGKICVSMFLFISGYGIYKIYENNINYKKVLKRIINLYLSYWMIFIIFVPLGILLGDLKINFSELFFNFIGLKHSINNEWWFFIDYIILIALYPIILNIIDKNNKYKILIISFIVFCVGCISNVILYRMNFIKLELIFNIMSLQFMFITGIIVSKYRIFNKLNNYIDKTYQFWILLMITFILLKLIPIQTLSFAVVTPIIMFIIPSIIKESIILKILGKHSSNIWLIHTFFCYYYFQELSFMPKYSIIIIIWVIILSLITSIILEKLKYYIKYIVIKIKYRNKVNNNELHI